MNPPPPSRLARIAAAILRLPLTRRLGGGTVLALLLSATPGAAAPAPLFAYHTKLATGADFERYSRTDAHPDIVVQLAEPPGRLVFWRGASYLPYWETSEGKFALEAIVPRQGDGDATRPDRVNAFSRVWLVEDKPDRVTVCWRYLPEFQGGNPYGGVNYQNFVGALTSPFFGQAVGSLPPRRIQVGFRFQF